MKTLEIILITLGLFFVIHEMATQERSNDSDKQPVKEMTGNPVKGPQDTQVD